MSKFNPLVLGLLAFLCWSAVAPHARADDAPAPPANGKTLDFRGIQIDKEKRTITFPAAINMTDGMLEYLIVAETGKTHESLLSTKIQPYDIQVAMLLLGIKPASRIDAEPPGQLTTQYLKSAPPMKGENVSLFVAWTDARGPHRIRAENLVRNTKENAAMMDGPWTYNGSGMYDGKFLAQVDGSVAALVRDSAALINNPRPGNDDDQVWKPDSKVAPKVGPAVDVIIALEENPAK